MYVFDVRPNMIMLHVPCAGGARGRLRNALIADSDDFAPIMGGGRFQLQTEDQETGTSPRRPLARIFLPRLIAITEHANLILVINNVTP